MFGNSYQQIQSWPTPKIWEGGHLGLREVSEEVPQNLALTSFVNFSPVDRTAPTDSAQTAIALTLWNNGGPTGDRTLTESGHLAAISLTQFIHYVAVDESVSDVNGTGLIQLTLMSVPTVSGDRTFTEPVNAGLALTKFQV